MTANELRDANIETRVERGAEWLDKHSPEWPKRIFPLNLDMDSALHDVFHMATGHTLFGYMLENSDESYSRIVEWGIDNGFMAIDDDDLGGLTEQWIATAHQRRASIMSSFAAPVMVPA